MNEWKASLLLTFKMTDIYSHYPWHRTLNTITTPINSRKSNKIKFNQNLASMITMPIIAYANLLKQTTCNANYDDYLYSFHQTLIAIVVSCMCMSVNLQIISTTKIFTLSSQV